MGIVDALVDLIIEVLLLPFKIFFGVILSVPTKGCLRKGPRFGLGGGG